jgi:hypothetical protein
LRMQCNIRCLAPTYGDQSLPFLLLLVALARTD